MSRILICILTFGLFTRILCSQDTLRPQIWWKKDGTYIFDVTYSSQDDKCNSTAQTQITAIANNVSDSICILDVKVGPVTLTSPKDRVAFRTNWQLVNFRLNPKYSIKHSEIDNLIKLELDTILNLDEMVGKYCKAQTELNGIKMKKKDFKTYRDKKIVMFD